MAEAMTKSPMKKSFVTSAGRKNDGSAVGNSNENDKVLSKTSTSKSKSTAKTDTSAVPASSTSMNIKEVMLVLKDLNNNLNTQNKRIEQQDERICQLNTKFDSIISENYENYDSNDYYHVDNEESLSQSENDYTDEPPSKKLKSSDQSIFKSLTEKFMQSETIDNEVNDDLASLVNGAFRSGITEEKQLEILKDIFRPSNCQALVKTRVNQGIWRLLKPYTQTDDSKLQTIQSLIVKASCNITKLLDKYSDEITDIEWGTNALVLLGQANKLINCRRKEMHKPDLDTKYHYLASSALPYTDYLYGEDCDVNKNVREINDMNRIGRNIRGNYQYQRGAGFTRGRRPSRRGRGRRWPRYESIAGSKNQKAVPRKN